MNTLEAIAARRSIREFQDTPVPDEALLTILRAATLAPSAKNRQPWRFIVVRGEARAEMIRLMRQGIARCKAEGVDLGSSEYTTGVMEHAPVTVFVINPYWGLREDEGFPALRDADIQSLGAAIQNMCLAAQDLGLGSLWICDVYYAYDELIDWLAVPGQMAAAVSLGYPAESPAARPRLSVEQVTRWM